MCFPRTGSASVDPQPYKGSRIPRVFEGIRARDSSVEETSTLGLGSSPEQESSEMLVLAMFLKLFKNIARTDCFCVRPVEREGRGWARATARVSLACEVGCSVFRIFRKKDEDSHGDSVKIELYTRGFRIPPSLNPHPRALSADLVLGSFLE